MPLLVDLRIISVGMLLVFLSNNITPTLLLHQHYSINITPTLSLQQRRPKIGCPKLGIISRIGLMHTTIKYYFFIFDTLNEFVEINFIYLRICV